MEANLFIKNAKVEGNKIKDIDFYGDWELDVATEPDPEREIVYVPDYIETYPFGADTLPYHVRYISRVYNGVEQFGISLNVDGEPCPFKYPIRVRGSIFNNFTGTLQNKQAIYYNEPTTETGQAEKTKGKLFLFSEDFKKCVGLTSIHWEI